MKRLAISLLIPIGLLIGQSKEELRRAYGEPVSETFLVRPGVGVTVTRSQDGRVVEMLIFPRNTDLIKAKGKTIDPQLVREIVDELAPEAARGKFLVGEFVNLTCLPESDCQGSSRQYENLTIYVNAGRDGGLNYAVVQWKKRLEK